MIKLFGLGGKKEPEKGPKMGKGFVPTDKVKELSGRGFSEPEIVDALRKEGFDSTEIDRALTQSLKIGVTGKPEESKESTIPTLQDLQSQSFAPQQEAEPMGPQMPEPMQYQQQQYYPQQEYGTEELIESVVHERMGQVDQKLMEMKAKNLALERSLADLHNQLTNMTKGRSQTEQAIITKIEVFKESLDEMAAHLSSLEKAFKEALPALIESVRALTELVNKVKKENP